MLKILKHQVWGLEEAVVASGLPMMTEVSVEDLDRRIQDLKDFHKPLAVVKSGSQGASGPSREIWELETDPVELIRLGDRCQRDLKRAKKLATCAPGSGHDSFLKGIGVTFFATFPAHWLIQFDRYHFADIVSSQSTMHCLEHFDVGKILADTCVDPVISNRILEMLEELAELKEELAEYKADDGKVETAAMVDHYDDLQIQYQDKWKQVMDSLPRGFTLTAYFTTNYLQLKSMYGQRRKHKLREWTVFCDWIETLPMWTRWFDPSTPLTPNPLPTKESSHAVQ